MTEFNASEVFVRDMMNVLTLKNDEMRERLMPRPDEQSVSSILDHRLAPLRILYIPEETARVSSPIEYPNTTYVPMVEPIPISRENATPPSEKPPLPYVANGKLIGQRHYGDYCINPRKNPDVVVVSPDDPTVDDVEAPPESGGACIII